MTGGRRKSRRLPTTALDVARMAIALGGFKDIH
jgi:hypothetical protein